MPETTGTSELTYLDAVWLNDEEFLSTTSGKGYAAMWLQRDGHGPMGYYDRIHVLDVDGRKSIYPAHMVQGWREAKVSP